MDDLALLQQLAAEGQHIARALADRQNSESTLSPRLATAIVNYCLNTGNTIERLVREARGVSTPKEIA